MAIEKETYVIGGPFKIRESGATIPFQFAGLVSTIQQTIETNEITLPDTTTPQGGEYDAVSRITSVGLSINFRELKTSILAALVWGTPPMFLLPPTPTKRTPPFQEARSRSTSCRWRSPA